MSSTKSIRGINDVLLTVQLSSPGTDENALPSWQRIFSWSLGLLSDVLRWKTIPDGTKNVNLPFNSSPHKSQKQASAAGGDSDVGDFPCHHPQCWMDKCKDRFVEVLLMVTSFLLLFATTGAFYFTQALAIVGSHDPNLKHTLAMFKWVFAASFFSNFLSMLVLLILQPRRELHQYKKFSLIIGSTTSFLFMLLGYGYLIAFNIQRRLA